MGRVLTLTWFDDEGPYRTRHVPIDRCPEPGCGYLKFSAIRLGVRRNLRALVRSGVHVVMLLSVVVRGPTTGPIDRSRSVVRSAGSMRLASKKR